MDIRILHSGPRPKAQEKRGVQKPWFVVCRILMFFVVVSWAQNMTKLSGRTSGKRSWPRVSVAQHMLSGASL